MIKNIWKKLSGKKLLIGMTIQAILGRDWIDDSSLIFKIFDMIGAVFVFTGGGHKIAKLKARSRANNGQKRNS